MALAVGDSLLFDGQSGTIRAVTSTTDANGRGSIVYGADTFSFRALKATVSGTDYPAVAIADAVFRVGVVQQDADPTLFCLALDDGPAPWGWGRRVQGKTSWAIAGEFAAQDSVVFRMGWAPGTITIKKGGVVQSGVYADLVFTYSTSDGTHTAWWQPAYPSKAGTTWGAKTGRFYTDANGVLWDWSDGTQQPIIVPRGFGALAYRTGDAWPSAPVAERTLSMVEVWYLQEHAEVGEGQATSLDIAAVSITVTGPASANCLIQWQDGHLRLTPETFYVLDGSGTVTATGMPPGRYSVWLGHPTDGNKGLRKQDVVAVSGGSYTVAFGASWSDPPTDQTQINVYGYGAEPGVGAELWCKTGPVGQEVYTLWGTADADGIILINGTVPGADDPIIVHPDWGALCIPWATSDRWIDATLAGRFSGYRAGQVGEYQEGIVPWGNGGNHINLPTMTRAVYAQDTVTGEKFYFSAASGGYGSVSEVCPRGTIVGIFDPANWTVRQYNIYDGDATLLLAAQTLPGNTVPVWTEALVERQQTTVGRLLAVVTGGKIKGNLVEYAPSQRITTADLTEAARMGLETGRFTQPIEVRSDSATASLSTKPAAWAAQECPYCGGPAWIGPNSAPYQRGYCIPCRDNGYTVDCRTYFLTQTLAAFADWSTRVVKNTTAGGHADKLVTGWPRPEEYAETDAYLVSNWQGLGIPRWVAVHIVLATYGSSAWSDGESIADAEARLGRTVGPVQLKLQLNDPYIGAGATVEVTATRADGGGSVVLTCDIPTGSQPGDLFFLRQGPHDTYLGVPCKWFTDVTLVHVTGQTNDLGFYVVNDGPAWNNSTGVVVTHHAYSPFACDLLLPGQRYPDLWHGPWDRTYLVWKDDSDIIQLQKSTDAGRTWTQPETVTPTGWTYPAVCKTIKGDLLVAATDTAETKTKVWRSRRDGASFASLAMSLVGTRMDMMTGMGPRKYGALLDGGQQELRETVGDFSTTLARPSALAAGGSSLKTSTVITTDAGAARAAILRDPKNNLFAALVNDASHVKVWRSRQNGFGWASCARSFVGTDPDVTLGPNQKAYLAARSGATVRWYRGVRELSTVLDSAIVTAEADAERPAVWKLNSRGREALAAVTVGGTVRIYGSKDDGRTWGQKA